MNEGNLGPNHDAMRPRDTVAGSTRGWRLYGWVSAAALGLTGVLALSLQSGAPTAEPGAQSRDASATLPVRIEQSGRPEPTRADHGPSVLAGGMRGPGPDQPPAQAEASRPNRPSRGARIIELQIIQPDGRRLVMRAVREPQADRAVVRYRVVSAQ